MDDPVLCMDTQLKHAIRQRCPGQDGLANVWQAPARQRIHELCHATRNGLQPYHGPLQEVACPTCGIYFASRTAMRIHHTKRHGTSLIDEGIADFTVRNELDISLHSTDGMPICKHCGTIFTRWTKCRHHVLSSCAKLSYGSQAGSAPEPVPGYSGSFFPCNKAKPTQPGENVSTTTCPPTTVTRASEAPQTAAQSPPASLIPTFSRDGVRALLATSEWKSVLQLPGVKHELLHHCSLCGQWVGKAAALKLHIRNLQHDAGTKKDDATAHSLTLAEGKFRPCRACSATPSSRTKHQCPVLFQLCLMRSLVTSQVQQPSVAQLLRCHGPDPATGDGRTFSVAHTERASPTSPEPSSSGSRQGHSSREPTQAGGASTPQSGTGTTARGRSQASNMVRSQTTRLARPEISPGADSPGAAGPVRTCTTTSRDCRSRPESRRGYCCVKKTNFRSSARRETLSSP